VEKPAGRGNSLPEAMITTTPSVPIHFAVRRHHELPLTPSEIIGAPKGRHPRPVDGTVLHEVEAEASEGVDGAKSIDVCT
jgi:hypothetical protein